MIKLKGKFENATIFTDNIEESALIQIKDFINDPISINTHVRIMPDVHAGAGCVIGLTAYLTGKIIPNLIGVDIGCGVSVWNLGNIDINFNKLDTFIKENIPTGFHINQKELLYDINLISNVLEYPYIQKQIQVICNKLNLNYPRVLKALGSLGSGNHFIEIDIDENTKDKYLIIHSGSRNFGLQIAKYHQNLTNEITKEDFQERIKNIINKYKSDKSKHYLIEKEIKKLKEQKNIVQNKNYLECNLANNYYIDMDVAQKYAKINRRIMGSKILKFLNNTYPSDFIESVHNYINFYDNILRKGAISAHENEKVVIPLNMKDGTLLGIGKGNLSWNYSAPHGAGRKMSRKKAKQELSLTKFKNEMKTVWSSCVNDATIDESPMAYKNSREIIKYLQNTVKITNHLKTIYNFKDTTKHKYK